MSLEFSTPWRRVGSSAIERTAKATGQTAKNTQRMMQKMNNGGLEFE
jgi:hypothetical protein